MTKLEKEIKESLRTGLSFGITSATITTLGIIVGLNATTGSRLTVIGGIMTIAIADAFSDSLGIHISEEAVNRHSNRAVWMSTIFALLSKLIFALTFIIPVLFLQAPISIIVSVGWGAILLALISIKIARDQKQNPIKVVFEHLLVAAMVLFLVNWVGTWIGSLF